jgi:hypothetical protein
MAGDTIDKRLFKFLPFEGWQFVEVTFESRDRDVKVPHTLNPESPEDVAYIPVRISGGAAVIYDQPTRIDTINAVTWTRDYIAVRSSLADVTVTLLLVLKRRSGTPQRAD